MTTPLDARMIVQALPMPVLVLDAEDAVLAASRAGVEMFIGDPARPGATNFVGKNFKDVVTEALRGPLMRAIGEAKSSAGASTRPRGASPKIEARPLRRDDGSLAAVLVVAREGTENNGPLSVALETANAELSAANDELAERLEEVRQAQRLEDERHQFLAMLAHELRNPLATITNALYLLRRRVNVGDRLAEQALRIAQRQAKSQARLVEDLLDVSRIVLGKITLRVEPTDLAAVVREAIAASELAVSSRAHRLRAELPEQPVFVLGDSVRLEQIVTNLLGNAVKYTPPGGEIAVVLSTTPETVALTVSDSGIGMEPALVERVFDLFAQGDATRARAAGGLGIGLTVVRKLVELHGGTIEARSRGRRQGSAFEVRLPRAAAVAVVPREPAPQPPRRARRVLVVDDNRDARELLRTILELDGHQVEDAGDAASAVRLAVEWTPDVALVDIGLPEVDGYEVARRIRKRLGRAVRLIALTGYGDPEARRLGSDAGFDEHLVKPVDPDRLSEVLAAS